MNCKHGSGSLRHVRIEGLIPQVVMQSIPTVLVVIEQYVSLLLRCKP